MYSDFVFEDLPKLESISFGPGAFNYSAHMTFRSSDMELVHDRSALVTIHFHKD